MDMYGSVPQHLIGDWPYRDVSHPGGDRYDYHFHEVEEWLEVRRGGMSFFPAGCGEHRVPVGKALRILRGEIHRVEVLPEGVDYRMWLSADVASDRFARSLDQTAMDLISRNLRVPNEENGWEEDQRKAKIAAQISGGSGAATPVSKHRVFLEDFVHTDLVFRTAGGALSLGRRDYIQRPLGNAPVVRRADDTVRVLHWADASIVLSTTVHTQQNGDSRSFCNIRTFVQEEGQFRCRIWINLPEL
jgi:hypothetical protein